MGLYVQSEIDVNVLNRYREGGREIVPSSADSECLNIYFLLNKYTEGLGGGERTTILS